MATINKKQAVKQQSGIPTKEDIMMSKENTDKVPAIIKGLDGVPKAQAALTEGEIVFSIPAIIAAGGGEYEKGADFLNGLHERLKLMGENMMQQQQGQNSVNKGLQGVR